MSGDEDAGWPAVAIDYVQAIADTKLLLGQRFGECDARRSFAQEFVRE